MLRALAYLGGAFVGGIAGALGGGAAFAFIWTVSSFLFDTADDLESALVPGGIVLAASAGLGALFGLAAVARDLTERRQG
jgi:hypothetical protein